ncbi:cell envelope integrity protein CreD [Candidatus Parcubacteria bacterium]|nr:cell envelope integrity protein CreD [Candidatus Parcubacteria bacterium]
MINKTTIKTSLSLKLFIIGFLIAILMIPTGMIAVLVNEREDRQEKAFREVSEKWGLEQSITGPVLTVPYKKVFESTIGNEKKVDEVLRYAHFLPKKLNVDGVINPEIRKRGIYEVVVYKTELEISGEFMAPDFLKWDIASEDIMHDKAFVSLGIPDMRGVKENIDLKWNDKKYAFKPGVETNDIFSSGVNSKVAIDKDDKAKKYNFSLKLVLNGSRDLHFTPIGKETNVKLASVWPDPSFQGAFLPNTHEITDQGFTANWKVLELNRNFPQSFLGALSGEPNAPMPQERFDKYAPTAMQYNNFSASDFGVRLLVVADEYQKTVRALKYSIMLLSLTFMILFFFEALNKKRVHPLQYILIGLSLSLFYVLLLSIAEHLGFDCAYFISVFSIVGLITFYSKSVFRVWKPAIIESLILIFIYGFIYIILQLEDYSLLVGAIGLFVILSIVMYVSRKIDWYNVNSAKDDKEIN